MKKIKKVLEAIKRIRKNFGKTVDFQRKMTRTLQNYRRKINNNRIGLRDLERKAKKIDKVDGYRKELRDLELKVKDMDRKLKTLEAKKDMFESVANRTIENLTHFSVELSDRLLRIEHPTEQGKVEAS